MCEIIAPRCRRSKPDDSGWMVGNSYLGIILELHVIRAAIRNRCNEQFLQAELITAPTFLLRKLTRVLPHAVSARSGSRQPIVGNLSNIAQRKTYPHEIVTSVCMEPLESTLNPNWG